MNESSIAVFIDFENLALGVRDLKGAKNFDISLVLKRLLEKGRIVYKRAYSDWSNYRKQVRNFHTQAIEMIDIPQSRMSGKNSADIRMVVDAIDLCHTKDNIDTFVLVSGDSDFSPLVSKLKENDKRVIGCGIKSSTSNLLVANCDEFIYYDDLVQASAKKRHPKKKSSSKKSSSRSSRQKNGDKEEIQAEKERLVALENVVEIIDSLQADYDPLWGSLVKQTVRRVHPGFSEKHYGYRNFRELLEDLEEMGYVDVEHDESRGNQKVWLAD